ncbi:MAG: hypothetical protein MO852_09850 [Candidatus Devosia euplotis]|nr:hypothetical protein [Candidatus Devosia euplotis]
MPTISNHYFRAAIVFLIIGIALDLHMSISGNHAVIGAHAHINLLGRITGALFGGYFALNPAKDAGRLPPIQFVVYIVGVAVMGISLYLLLAGNPALEPVVAISSVVTFLSVLLFAWIIWAPAPR